MKNNIIEMPKNIDFDAILRKFPFKILLEANIPKLKNIKYFNV
jgi:hypothetical protein